jgi:hypothetical protein
MSGEAHLKLVPPPRGEEPDDLALARAAAGKDAQALSALLDRVFDRVRRTTSYLAQGRADAEDLLQLALIEIARSVSGFRGECPRSPARSARCPYETSRTWHPGSR